MVRKIACLLLITTTCQAAAVPRPLLIEWKGSRGSSCQGLIEAFLTELRGLAGDRRIQLDMTAHVPEGSDARLLTISCDVKANALAVQSGDEVLQLNYRAKAGGFDPADWVPIQEHFLRPENREVALAPPSLAQNQLTQSPSPPAMPTAVASWERDAGNAGLSPAPASTEATAPAPTRPFYRQWWFWTLAAAAVGATTFLLVRPFQGDPRTINVEIH